jgi:hypothetical protein
MRRPVASRFNFSGAVLLWFNGMQKPWMEGEETFEFFNWDK